MNLKRFAAIALLLPDLAQAELSRLDVQITPDSAHYEKDDGVTVTATGNGTGMEYRFVLERNGTVILPVVSTNWSAANSFEFDFAPYNVLPGGYRVNVLAREAANRKIYMTKLEYFRVGSLPRADAAVAEKQALVRARYEYAQQVLRQSMLSVYKGMGAGRDLTPHCYDMQTAQAVIDVVLNPNGQRAPDGVRPDVANAFASSAGGDAAVGAVGVTAVTGCDVTTPEVWDQVAFTVYLPAYPAGGSDPLEPESTVIRFADVLSAQESPARREQAMALVRGRYETAAAVLRQQFAQLRTRQSMDGDLTSECTSFASDDGVAHLILNRARASAPMGGPAFVTGPANAATGAIGVETVEACTDPFDWRGVRVTLHLPAFLDLPAGSVTVGYDR